MCRLIYFLYLNQKNRIKWGNSLSKCFKVTNGVKQGAVLSPIILSVYIDVLITRLRTSNIGCYIGNTCMSVFSYSDDLIILAPTKQSMHILLDVCDKYASDYNVKFNPKKSKLIVYSDKQKSDDTIDFNGVTISSVQIDLHLGNIIGNNIKEQSVKKIINDILKRFNVLFQKLISVNTSLNTSFFKHISCCLYIAVYYGIFNTRVFRRVSLTGVNQFDVCM